MSKNHFRILTLGGSFLFIFLYACVDHNLVTPVVDCTGVSTISFADDVKPIIDTKCAITGCHNGDNGADKNWTVFANFQNHAAEVQNRITLPAGASGHMPAAGSLTDAQLQTIYCWVSQGAENN